MSFSGAGHFDTEILSIASHDVRWMGSLGGSTASAGYPAANLALYVPFTLSEPATVQEAWVESGTLTTSNTVDIGVYDTAGGDGTPQVLTGVSVRIAGAGRGCRAVRTGRDGEGVGRAEYPGSGFRTWNPGTPLRRSCLRARRGGVHAGRRAGGAEE